MFIAAGLGAGISHLRALTIPSAQGVHALSSQHWGESLSFPGFSSGLSTVSRSPREVQLCALRGAHHLGTGMKALVPSWAVAGWEDECGAGGAVPGAGGASSETAKSVPSANKCSPLFQAVELTAFKSSGNICLPHFL